MAPTRIHHINFVVRDLEQAVLQYERKLGFPPFTMIDHALRGSRIATSRIGESYFVLVCPYDEHSVPGRHLQEHGEGFFMLSLGVADISATIETLQEAVDIRDGIEDWQVADIGSWFGADLQLTREKT